MKLDPIEAFLREKKERIKSNAKNISLIKASVDFTRQSIVPKYSYNFTWLGRPIIQYYQDMIAMKEIIWQVKPDLIIETGIAHGESLIFYASMLELLGGDGQVLGIDIDICEHNRKAIEAHPMFRRISISRDRLLTKILQNRSITLPKIKKGLWSSLIPCTRMTMC